MPPLTARQRSLIERVIMAVVLPAVAGAVNASGFIEVGAYTSHMTGNTTRIGDELAVGNYPGALASFAMVALFFTGSLAATLFIERSKTFARARYMAPLLTEMVCLGTFAYLAGTRTLPGNRLVLACLLCFAMGLQNAMVTHISSAVVRTTHLTGLITDSGAEVGRLIYWLLRRLRQPHRSAMWLEFAALKDSKQLGLHGSIIGSFLMGAFAGPQLFLTHGQVAMLLPLGLLAILVVFDVLLGFGTPSPIQDGGA